MRAIAAYMVARNGRDRDGGDESRMTYDDRRRQEHMPDEPEMRRRRDDRGRYKEHGDPEDARAYQARNEYRPQREEYGRAENRYTPYMPDIQPMGGLYDGGGIGFGLCEDITHAVIDEEIITSPRRYHTITEAKNGAGATPIKCDKGWIHIAHGVRNTAAGLRYVLYAFMTDLMSFIAQKAPHAVWLLWGNVAQNRVPQDVTNRICSQHPRLPGFVTECPFASLPDICWLGK